MKYKMSEQPRETTRSRVTFVPEKPIHTTRHMMIASRIRDVIQDHVDLTRDHHKLKRAKQELASPMATAYTLGRNIRELAKIEAKMEKEIAKCDMADIERLRLINEVFGKCETLKMMLDESEKEYTQLKNQLNTHLKVTKSAVKEEKHHCKEVSRYLKAGESLVELREIMGDVITENKCYFDFMEGLAGGSGVPAISQSIARFENCISINGTLTRLMNESLERSELHKADLLKKKDKWEFEQSIELARLQTIQRETAEAQIINARFEKSLNNVTVESVAHLTQLNGMLKSAEQMLEDLIQRKVIERSYRKKTLAQQFEAIKNDYVKRKAIICEYKKGKDMIDRRRTARLAQYNVFSKKNLVKAHHFRVIEDLYEKKRMKAIMRRYDKYMKLKKKLGPASDAAKEEVYDPLEDKDKILKISDRMRYSSFPDEDNEDESDDDVGEIDLATYSDANEFDAPLNNEASADSFISASSESLVGFSNRSIAVSRANTMGSIISGGSAGSYSSIGGLKSVQNFMKQTR